MLKKKYRTERNTEEIVKNLVEEEIAKRMKTEYVEIVNDN